MQQTRNHNTSVSRHKKKVIYAMIILDKQNKKEKEPALEINNPWMVTNVRNTIVNDIIIYDDFLPPPRRGHVKSDNTHTQSST